MKKNTKSVVFIALAICLLLAACGNVASDADVWESAMYSEDAELGEGAKTAVVEVKAGEKLVTFTVKTDEETLGAALLEHSLIDGEDSQFGLYLKVVNGITADYDEDKSYWAFYIDGEYATSGVDGTKITEGAIYRLERTK